MEFKLKKNTSAPVKFAFAELKAGRYMRAMRSFSSIIAASPDDDQAMFGMALARYGIKDPSDPVCLFYVPVPMEEDYFYQNAQKYADDENAAIYDLIAVASEQSRMSAIDKWEKSGECGIYFYASFPENDDGGVTEALSDELYDALEEAGYDVLFTDVSTDNTKMYPLAAKALDFAKCVIIFGHTAEQFSSAGCENMFLSRLASAKEGRLNAKSLITVYHSCPENDIPEELFRGTVINSSDKNWVENALATVAKFMDSPVAPKGEHSFDDEKVSIAISGMHRYLKERKFDKVMSLSEEAAELDPDNDEIFFLRLLASAECVDDEELSSHTSKLPEEYENYSKLEEIGGEFYYIAKECNLKAIDERERIERDAEFARQRLLEEERLAEEERLRREELKNKEKGKEEGKEKEKDTLDDLDESEYEDFDSSFEGKSNRNNSEGDEDIEDDCERGGIIDFIRSKKLIFIAAAAIALIVAIIILSMTVFIPASNYNKAIELYDSHDYLKASAAFEKLGSFSDSEKMAQLSKYYYAVTLFNNDNYRTATEYFKALGNFNDSAELALLCEKLNAAKLTGKEDPVYSSHEETPYFSLDPATGALRFDASLFDGTELVIPDVFDGSLVTAISGYAFSGNTNLKSVKVGDGVTQIGEYAFSNCPSLESVILPDCVETVGRYAFNNCIALKSVTLPESLVSIPNNAFNNCTALESVKFGTKLESIGDRAFYGCENLTEISLPESLITIKGDAFGSCTKLERVKFGSRIEEIGKSAFDGSKFLSSLSAEFVIIGNGVLLDYNGESANVIIPDGVKFISSAFTSCASMKSVTIPSSCVKVGDGAFYKCTSLESVVIPEGVTSLGDSAFYYCAALKTITISKSVVKIGDFAFYKCAALSSVKYTGTSSDFAKIEIGTSNTDMTGAAKTFGYAE